MYVAVIDETRGILEFDIYPASNEAPHIFVHFLQILLGE